MFFFFFGFKDWVRNPFTFPFIIAAEVERGKSRNGDRRSVDRVQSTAQGNKEIIRRRYRDAKSFGVRDP